MIAEFVETMREIFSSGGGSGNCGRIPHVRGTSFRPLGGVVCLLFLRHSPRIRPGRSGPGRSRRSGPDPPWRASARLELPGGRALRVDLPERAEVSSLAAIDAGWVAAGSSRIRGRRGRQLLFLLTGSDKASRALAEPPGQTGRNAAVPCSWWTAAGSPASPGWKGTATAPSPCAPPPGTGTRWQAAQWVSQPGPGSQLALTGAVLADGSWLLAWSAFDGTADEIVWSRRVGRRLVAGRPGLRAGNCGARHHPRPDRHGRRHGGALLAWSRYDGHGYRLRIARFERRRRGATSAPPRPPARSTPPSSATPTARAWSTWTPQAPRLVRPRPRRRGPGAGQGDRRLALGWTGPWSASGAAPSVRMRWPADRAGRRRRPWKGVP